MRHAARQGGSVGSPAGAFPDHPIPRRVAGACALLLALLWLAPAHGGALYRCVGTSGETVFSGTTEGYRGCRRVADFAPPRRAAAHGEAKPKRVPATAAAEMPPAATVRFAGLQSSVETSARRIEAPPAAPAGKAGQWSYAESAAPPPSAPLASQEGGARVLRGAVYRVVHRDGSVEYTNLRPSGPARTVTMLFSYIATCMACNLHSPIDWGRVRLDLASYAGAVHAASGEFGVDEAFLRAVIHAESAFNPRALSLKGAQGLMQLMPGTASDMGVLDAFDPEQNIRGGARYLAQLLRTFNGDERLAAAAYNAGPAAVQRYNGVPPFAETQVYVQRVGALRKRYGDALPRSLAVAGGSL
jgi:soluble lytic murein transglycosylase-like protein